MFKSLKESRMSEEEKNLISEGLTEAETVLDKDAATVADDDKAVEELLDKVPEHTIEPITAEDLKELENEPEPTIDDLLESLTESEIPAE